MKRIYYFGAGLAVCIAFLLLWKTGDVSTGVSKGLTTCGAVIIPSLFPFMILAGLISATPIGTALSRVMGFILRPLHIPQQVSSVFLMSFLGGFPVGARMLADLLEQNEIDRNTAQKALCFCVNAGPSFLISAVGARMLGSLQAGLLLLCAQILSSLLIAAFLFRKADKTQKKSAPSDTPVRASFVGAVQSASAGMIGICAFVIVFSAINALLQSTGVFAALSRPLANLTGADEAFFTAFFTGILEVTSGCMLAAKLPARTAFILCAFFVSFSSCSIIFQVKSCFSKQPHLKFGAFYGSRLAHGLLTTFFAMLLWRVLPATEIAVFAAAGSPVIKAEPNMLISSACLIGMCTILLLPAKNRTHHQRPLFRLSKKSA